MDCDIYIPPLSSGPPQLRHPLLQADQRRWQRAGRRRDVSANQDVVVTAFVGWVGYETAHYECVTRAV